MRIERLIVFLKSTDTAGESWKCDIQRSWRWPAQWLCGSKQSSLSPVFLFSASEWMASASLWEFLDVLPPHMDSALMNLTTMALGLDKVTPFHVYTQEKSVWCGLTLNLDVIMHVDTPVGLCFFFLHEVSYRLTLTLTPSLKYSWSSSVHSSRHILRRIFPMRLLRNY